MAMKYSILCESKFTVYGIGVDKHLLPTKTKTCLERYDPTFDTCKVLYYKFLMVVVLLLAVLVLIMHLIISL